MVEGHLDQSTCYVTSKSQYVFTCRQIRITQHGRILKSTEQTGKGTVKLWDTFMMSEKSNLFNK